MNCTQNNYRQASKKRKKLVERMQEENYIFKTNINKYNQSETYHNTTKL